MHINDIAPFKMVCAEFYEKYKSGLAGLDARRLLECKDVRRKTIEYKGPGHPLVMRPMEGWEKHPIMMDPRVFEILKKAERLSLKLKAEDEAREQNS